MGLVLARPRMAFRQTGVFRYIQNEEVRYSFTPFHAHAHWRPRGCPVSSELLVVGCRRRTEAPRHVITVMCVCESWVCEHKKRPNRQLEMENSRSPLARIISSVFPACLTSRRYPTLHQSSRTPLPPRSSNAPFTPSCATSPVLKLRARCSPRLLQSFPSFTFLLSPHCTELPQLLLPA